MMKKGSQQAMKEPMMSPKINVALFSFFRATLRFSRSGSRGFCTLGTTCSTINSSLWFFFLPSDRRFLGVLLPKIGLHSLSFKGFTTVHLATTPESELLGSNSLTMSVSMPMECWRVLAMAAACCWSSPFTDRVDPLNWHCDSELRTTWALGNTWKGIS